MNTISFSLKPQRGIALITSLLIMILLGLLALPLLRGYGLEQKIAGNTREKERAFQGAVSALQYGEWWITNGEPGTGADCTTQIAVPDASAMRTCSNELAITSGDPDKWPGISRYSPPQMKFAAPGTVGGTTKDGNDNDDINYSKVPGLYVAYLGLSANGMQTLYSVTGIGFGGSDNTSSIVRSVFQTGYSITDLGGP